MLRFLTPVDPKEKEKRQRVDMENESICQKVREVQSQKKPKRTHARQPWHQWEPSQKADLARQYLAGRTELSFRLQLKDQCPPMRTIQGWAALLKTGMPVRRMGRPSVLYPEEEGRLLELIAKLRAEGATINKAALIFLATEVVNLTRPGAEGSPPLVFCTPAVSFLDIAQLSVTWAKSFKRRHNMSNIRRGTTDRVIERVEDIEQDNKWRHEFLDVVANAGAYGIPMPPEYQSLFFHHVPSTFLVSPQQYLIQ